MASDSSNVTTGNAHEDMHTRFRNEFGIHFSESELQFALSFLDEVFEEGRDIGMKADEALREEAIAQYQTEYEQKHIASAVEIARKEEQNKIIKLLQEKKLEYCGEKDCDQSHCATRHTRKIVIDDIINYIRS